jgi:cytochrome c556
LRLIRISLTVLAGLFFLSVASQAFGQAEVIKKRRALMKSNDRARKAIKAAIAEKDFATIESKAKVIVRSMDKVLDLFPKGSTSEKSRARNEIWERWGEFSERRDEVKTAAAALAKAAAANDEAQVKVQTKAVGEFNKGACGNCHKTFYKSKKKKKTGISSITEGDPARLSRAEKVEIAKQVKSIFSIFKNKCAKCHGPEGVRTWTKPNADFDYVLDLEKLSSNPEMIVRGDPNESKLFQSVDDEIMPNEEEGEEPLPANEKDIIRRWILVGAPTEEGVSPKLNQ